MEGIRIIPATSSNQNNASSPSDKLIQQPCLETKIRRPCLTIENHLNDISDANLRTAYREINFKERLLTQANAQRVQQLKQLPLRYEMKRAIPKPKDKAKLPEKHKLLELFDLNLKDVHLTDTHEVPKTVAASDSQKSLLKINTNAKSVKDVFSKYADPTMTDVKSQSNTSYGFKQRLKPLVHKISKKTIFNSIHDILKASFSKDKIKSLIKAERSWTVDPGKKNYSRQKQSKENIISHSGSDRFRRSYVHRDKKRTFNRIPNENSSSTILRNPIQKSINVLFIEPVKSRTLQNAVESVEDKGIENLKETIEADNTSEKSTKIKDLQEKVKIPEKYSSKNSFNKYYQNVSKTAIVRDDSQQYIKGHINTKKIVDKTISNQSIESKSRLPKDQVEINENTIQANGIGSNPPLVNGPNVESNFRISNSKEMKSTATIPDQHSGNKLEILKEKMNENEEQKKNDLEKIKLKAVSKKATENSKTKEFTLIFDKTKSDQNSGSELKTSEENAEQKDNYRESIRSSYNFDESVVNVVHFKSHNVEKITGKKQFDRSSKSPEESVKKNLYKNTKQRRRSREKLKTSALSNSKAKKFREINDKTISRRHSGGEGKILKEKINENAEKKKKAREKTKSKAVSKNSPAKSPSKTKELKLIFDKKMSDRNSGNKREILEEKTNKNDEQEDNSREPISSSINLKESGINLKESVALHFRSSDSKSVPKSVKNNFHKNTKQKVRSREKLKPSVESKKAPSNSKGKKIRKMFDRSVSYHYSGSEPEISKVKINKKPKQTESSREIHKTSFESEKSLVSSKANNVDSYFEIGRKHSSKEMSKSTKQKKISHERIESSTEPNKSLLNSKTEKITTIFDKKIPEQYSESEPKNSRPKKKIRQKIICGYIFREKSNTNAKAKEKIVPLKQTPHKVQSKENAEKLMDLKSYPDSDAIKQLRRTLKLKAPWRSNSWMLEDAFHKRKQYETYVLAHQYLLWKRKRELRHILKVQEKGNVTEAQNSIVPKKRKRRRKRQSSGVVCFRKNKYKDPTALLNYYKCQWDRFQTKFPGESVHSELRQIIHEKMRAQPYQK